MIDKTIIKPTDTFKDPTGENLYDSGLYLKNIDIFVFVLHTIIVLNKY
jgi:hypothetical protein